MIEREKILKLADGVSKLRGYTNDEIVASKGVAWEATDGTPYNNHRLILINAEHRDLIVAALLAFAGPDQ